MGFGAGRQRVDELVSVVAVVAVVAISVAATARRRVSGRVPLLHRF